MKKYSTRIFMILMKTEEMNEQLRGNQSVALVKLPVSQLLSAL